MATLYVSASIKKPHIWLSFFKIGVKIGILLLGSYNALPIGEITKPEATAIHHAELFLFSDFSAIINAMIKYNNSILQLRCNDYDIAALSEYACRP